MLNYMSKKIKYCYLADISFEAKQMFVQNTGSTNSSDIYCYMQYKSGNSDDIVFSDPNFIIE